MPTNVGSEALSALKVGESTVSKAYVGHNQIFPNSTEITSLDLYRANSSNFSGTLTSFPNTGSSGQGVSGGYLPKITVAGEIGSQFSVVGTTAASWVTKPIFNKGGCNLSFAGLKTAILKKLMTCQSLFLIKVGAIYHLLVLKLQYLK